MSTAVMGGRRSTVEIIHEILSLCDKGGINKTAEFTNEFGAARPMSRAASA